MTDGPIVLAPGALDLQTLRRLAAGTAPVSLADGWRPTVEAGRAAIERLLASGRAVYGVNTGFGRLANTRIAADKLAELQSNLILSHAVGIGPALADRVVRLAVALKLGGLARGYSGVRPALVEALAAMDAAGIVPCVPAQGSVGASGDLAPLAHIGVALLGVGEVRVGGRTCPAAEALAEAGLAPVTLEAKEGLALLNGTQVSTALALDALFRAERVFAAALVAGAMTTDAALGSDTPFDPRISAVRGQPGQIAAAARYRSLLAGSALRASHLDCDRVQDPYCLRCQPQVMGACLDGLARAADVLVAEANAVSDNPLVFPETGEVLSGGNFHAEPVAQAADAMAVAIAEIGALAERRIAMLIDSGFSELPPFLTREPGLNSGFMIAHVAAASLASELKSMAHPASVDSLPTSANQEDHVSMATFAARRLGPMIDNVERIVAIEWLAAAQGLDLRRPLTSSVPLERAHAALRAVVPAWEADRFFHPDIEAARTLVADGTLASLAGAPVLDIAREPGP